MFHIKIVWEEVAIEAPPSLPLPFAPKAKVNFSREVQARLEHGDEVDNMAHHCPKAVVMAPTSVTSIGTFKAFPTLEVKAMVHPKHIETPKWSTMWVTMKSIIMC